MSKDTPDRVAPPEHGIDPVRVQFIQSQMTYYTSHLRHADAKVAGIIAFSTATAGVTADALTLETMQGIVSLQTVGILGLLLSLFAIITAFMAVWPRTRKPKDLGESAFGWSSVSRLKPISAHASHVMKHPPMSLIEGMAHVARELAGVINAKYRWIKLALWGVIPATALHVGFWTLA